MIHSYSSLKLWLTCPAQFRAKYIDRSVPRSDDSPALVKGRQVHEALEKAVETGEPPRSVWTPPGLLPALRAAGAKPEQAYAIRRDGTPCDFWDKDGLIRGKIDVEMVDPVRKHAVLIDWKTGQYRVDEFQADVYTALLRAIHGEDLTVDFTFIYVDAKRTAQVTPDGGATHRVETLIEQCEADTVHEPRPCWACRFCPVTSCVYNGG